MKYFGEGLSEIHKELNQIIRKADKIEQSKKLFLMLHAKLHLSEISGTERNEVDSLVDDLSHDEYAIMPTVKDETIAWVIWHIARIEDLTMSILVADENQLFDIGGILLMPPTRHVMLHINDCYKWKQFFRTKKNFYRS